MGGPIRSLASSWWFKKVVQCFLLEMWPFEMNIRLPRSPFWCLSWITLLKYCALLSHFLSCFSLQSSVPTPFYLPLPLFLYPCLNGLVMIREHPTYTWGFPLMEFGCLGYYSSVSNSVLGIGPTTLLLKWFSSNLCLTLNLVFNKWILSRHYFMSSIAIDICWSVLPR